MIRYAGLLIAFEAVQHLFLAITFDKLYKGANPHFIVHPTGGEVSTLPTAIIASFSATVEVFVRFKVFTAETAATGASFYLPGKPAICHYLCSQSAL
jgi:hypothetical protein